MFYFHGYYIRTSLQKYLLPLFPIFLNAKKNLSMFEENVGGFQVKEKTLYLNSVSRPPFSNVSSLY
jgi:hypothetical protein